jgi:hypothetical protein
MKRFPSSQRRGGCAVNYKLRSHLVQRRRGGRFGAIYKFRRSDHPVRSSKEASQHLFMSRPPLLCEEENAARLKLTTTHSAVTLLVESFKHILPVPVGLAGLF